MDISLQHIMSWNGGITKRRLNFNSRKSLQDQDSQQDRKRFTSAILPPYLRRTKSIETLLPWLYLKGISTGSFTEALGALLSKDTPGLSPATTISRLKSVWQEDYRQWQQRDLSNKRYAYFWADGIYCNVRRVTGSVSWSLSAPRLTATRRWLPLKADSVKASSPGLRCL